MARGKAIRAKIAGGLQKVREFDRLVAANARDGRRPRQIGIGKVFHHLLAELGLVIEHIVRNADLVGHIPGIMDVLPGAARALLLDGRAMIVELQRDTDHVIALRLQHGGHDRAVDSARHGSDDARFRGRFGKSKRVHAAIPGRRQFISHVSLQPG